MKKNLIKKTIAGITVALMLISSVGISGRPVNAEEPKQGQEAVEQTQTDVIVVDEDMAEENMGDPTIIDQGVDGGVSWSLDSDGYLEVNVTGDLSYVPDYHTKHWPWYDYAGTIITAKVSGQAITITSFLFFYFHFLSSSLKKFLSFPAKQNS